MARHGPASSDAKSAERDDVDAGHGLAGVVWPVEQEGRRKKRDERASNACFHGFPIRGEKRMWSVLGVPGDAYETR
jgi:hypothetical protein